MLERFTRGARSAVVDAQAQARGLAHSVIQTEHLLLALLVDPDEPAARVLNRLGVPPADIRASIRQLAGGGARDAEALASIGIDLAAVRARVEEAFGPGALDRPRLPRLGRHLPFSRRAKKALELALREAIRTKSSGIGTEHLLLGLLREGEGLAAVVLARYGVDRIAVERALEALRREDGSGQANAG